MFDPAKYFRLCDRAKQKPADTSQGQGTPSLSALERELLVAAAKIGQFFVVLRDRTPSGWLEVGSQKFMDEEDPAVAARYWSAFDQLCTRGYIDSVSDRCYVLTGAGFDVARSLAEKIG